MLQYSNLMTGGVGPFMDEWLWYNFATGSFHTKKLCSRLYLIESKFYLKKKNKKSLFEPPFGDLGVMYALHLQLVRKPVVDFVFVITELLRLRRYKRKSVKIGVFLMGVGHFECKFQTEGGVARQPLLVSEN